MSENIPNLIEVECDYCPNKYWTAKSNVKAGDNACPSCLKAKQVPTVSPDLAPININKVLQQQEQIDNSIAVRTDIFNAETVAIADIKKAIDADVNITNKAYALAEAVALRREKFKRVIFEIGEQMKLEQNKLRATQQYLNQLSNQLRSDEREKLKISDINYKPQTVKMPVTAKTVKASVKKLDKDELRKLSVELGIQEHTLRMFAIAKHCGSVDDVRRIWKKVMETTE